MDRHARLNRIRRTKVNNAQKNTPVICSQADLIKTIIGMRLPSRNVTAAVSEYLPTVACAACTDERGGVKRFASRLLESAVLSMR